MKNLNIFHFGTFFLIFSCQEFSRLANAQCGNGVQSFARICYFTNWAVYREGKGQYTPANIDPSLCTHVMYAFSFLDQSLDKIVPSDPSVDLNRGFYRDITNLQQRGVVPVLSLAGWSDSTEKYSQLLNDDNHRANVVNFISKFLQDNKFLGLDVDIEYPNAYQGNVRPDGSRDKELFVQFLNELRTKFDSDFENGLFPQKPTLSMAANGANFYMDKCYDVPGIAAVLTWIGVMAYDVHSQSEGKTGLIAPFSPQPGDANGGDSYVKALVNNWVSRGAPANKIVVGIPCYGASYHLSDTSQTGINAPASGSAAPGPVTKSSGALAFYEIIDYARQGWSVVHVNNVGSYAFKDDQWVGYDDKRDVARKADYVRENCFFGSMIWALDFDCFQSDCPAGQYPLLTTLRDVLTGAKSSTDVQNAT